MNQERIGKFISLKRKEKKLTQEQVAEKLSQYKCRKQMGTRNLFNGYVFVKTIK